MFLHPKYDYEHNKGKSQRDTCGFRDTTCNLEMEGHIGY
jgi:hypothetical protein